MIFYFRAQGDVPFNSFVSDNYEQIRTLWNYEDDLKRFLIINSNYLDKHPEQRDYNHNKESFIDNDPFKKVSVKNIWKPLEVSLYSKAKSRKIGDISTLDSSNSPVFSEKAVNILGDLLENNGEFLELKCISDGKTYYLYHVLTYVDIIDPEKIGSTYGVYFTITNRGIEKLREENLDEQVIESLKPLLDKCFSKSEFDDKLSELEISEEQKSLVMKRATSDKLCYHYKENIDFDKLSIFRLVHPKAYLYNFMSKKFMERAFNNNLKGIIPWTDFNFFEESVTNKEQLSEFHKFQNLIYEGRKR